MIDWINNVLISIGLDGYYSDVFCILLRLPAVLIVTLPDALPCHESWPAHCLLCWCLCFGNWKALGFNNVFASTWAPFCSCQLHSLTVAFVATASPGRHSRRHRCSRSTCRAWAHTLIPGPALPLRCQTHRCSEHSLWFMAFRGLTYGPTAGGSDLDLT